MAVDLLVLKRRLCKFATGYIGQSNSGFQHRDKAITSRMSSRLMKPPNVLIYQSKHQYLCTENCLATLVSKCLPASRYVVYHLRHDRAVQDPWMDNCQLLVIPSCDAATNTEFSFISNYINKGGRVLNFSLALAKMCGLDIVKVEGNFIDGNLNVIEKDSESDVTSYLKTRWPRNAFAPKESYSSILSCQIKEESTPITVALKRQLEKNGTIVHCSLPLAQYCEKNNCKQVDKNMYFLMRKLLRHLGFEQTINEGNTSVKLTPCFLLCSKPKLVDKFFLDMKVSKVGPCIKGESLHLRLTDILEFEVSKTCEASTGYGNEKVPLYYSPHGLYKDLPLNFNWEKYYNSLTSKLFGQLIIYSEVTSSTMDIAEALLGRLHDVENFCITCIANQQTKGKGRGGNVWLSPPGTAMLTVAFSVPLRSRLGERLPILQHMMTVAVVHAIRSLPGLHDLDLRVKWPNDIYFGSSVKIGGVLVRSTIFRDTCATVIGCGINVSNTYPTCCVNQVIQASGIATSLSCEEVLGYTISQFENIISEFQNHGPKSFLDLYYKYWLHSGQRIKVTTKSDGILDAVIVGIDDVGFLRAQVENRAQDDGMELSLCPNDNSFDMMKNVIAMKSV